MTAKMGTKWAPTIMCWSFKQKTMREKISLSLWQLLSFQQHPIQIIRLQLDTIICSRISCHLFDECVVASSRIFFVRQRGRDPSCDSMDVCLDYCLKKVDLRVLLTDSLEYFAYLWQQRWWWKLAEIGVWWCSKISLVPHMGFNRNRNRWRLVVSESTNVIFGIKLMWEFYC